MGCSGVPGWYQLPIAGASTALSAATAATAAIAVACSQAEAIEAQEEARNAGHAGLDGLGRGYSSSSWRLLAAAAPLHRGAV